MQIKTTALIAAVSTALYSIFAILTTFRELMHGYFEYDIIRFMGSFVGIASNIAISAFLFHLVTKQSRN